ncbi:MAG TPA: PHP domain-containing protein [Nevskiaceae bacterium]|nr:PHP domain-containing protein [Nevskiaceae bacterium]
MPQTIDLHCHSTASDGVLPPAEVVAAAHAAGITTLALTDHDTLAGLAEAHAAARARGLQLINGVELSACWGAHTIHIVALDFDADNEPLRAGLARLQSQRTQRAQRIAAKLEALGVARALERTTALAAGGQVTRSHFARLLVQDGLCRTPRRAFQRFLGHGKRAWSAAPWGPLAEAIEWIHAAGGQAVLAHPLLYGFSRTQVERLLEAFCRAGGTAMEVCNGTSGAADVVRSAALACEYKLQGSMGSDCHDPAQPWRTLGATPPLPPNVPPVWRAFRRQPVEPVTRLSPSA